LVKPYNPYTIVIGDSVTDFGMSQVADNVFARSALCNELDRLKVDYTMYSTFNEVLFFLKKEL
jgi:2-hydroxy-3-keto-5-methylthiopentenyl-1-phosphate phosphatase